MKDREIKFKTNLFEFAESQISNALTMLPVEIDIQYKDPKFQDMNKKLKDLLYELDSSELITTQQAMQIIEPMVKISEGELAIMATNIGLVLNDLMTFIFNSAMAKLAARDDVDTSWDIENNRVDFWISIVDDQE